MKLTFVIILFSFTTTSLALTIELEPTKDNTLFETNLIGLSNGAGDYFFVGRTNQMGNQLRRGLVFFDLSVVPPGSTINDAHFEITSSQTVAGEKTISIHKALQDWGESTSDAPGMEGPGTIAEIGDATWTNAFLDGAAWDDAGGDYEPAAQASTNINGLATIAFNSVALTAQVQQWVDDSSDNYGWVILGDESEARTAYRFNTRENNDITSRPKLIIDYSLPVSSLTPSKDNTLFESNDGSISNGSGNKIFFGKPNNGQLRRSVIEFDVSGLPEFAQIAAVELELTVIDTPGTAQSGTAALHFALVEWGQGSSSGNGQGAPSETGDATWIHSFYDTDNWNNAGGDFMAMASASSDFTNSSSNIVFNSTAALVADVSTWLADSNNNHGWVILGDENNNGNVRSVGSLENSSSSNRPILTIEYFVPVDLIFADGFDDD